MCTQVGQVLETGVYKVGTGSGCVYTQVGQVQEVSVHIGGHRCRRQVCTQVGQVQASLTPVHQPLAPPAG